MHVDIPDLDIPLLHLVTQYLSLRPISMRMGAFSRLRGQPLLATTSPGDTSPKEEKTNVMTLGQ